MALTGDAIITRRLSVFREPSFLSMIESIRNADVAFTNLEMLFHDYEPWPAHQSGGTWMRAEPELARELVWAGFDLVSMANNHTGDYGVDGMRLTQKAVREAGLVGAGTGENLAEAREARFIETHGARVALVSVASTFPEHSAAGEARGAVRGRPGLNPLRHTRTRIVTRDQLEALRAALRGAGVGAPAQGNRLSVFGEAFEVGEAPRTRTRPDEQDVAEIAAVVRNAAALADYVIVTIHAHEGAPGNMPAEFLVAFAHAMVDAGADVFVGHGPHVLKGIEVYRGKPIFYSLGDFIFQNETLLRLPAANYAQYDLGENQWVADFNDARYAGDTRSFPANREIWESVIAFPVFRGKQLTAIELHPITLGFGLPRQVRGRPLPADPELGRKIIDDLIERSRPFGTTIEWRDGIGHVRLDQAGSLPRHSPGERLTANAGPP
ncbi:MAG: CapA family protein [Gemmatimonadetes bacterium]|nr:CapA family protein [Gemmatimonadota bacterium]